MRKIERSNAFKKDYKRLLKGNYQSVLGEDLVTVLKLLVADKPLDENTVTMS